MNNNSKNFLGYVALLTFFGVTGFVFGAFNTPTTAATTKNTQQAAASTALTNPSVFADISLVAKAAYVFDITADESAFAQNETAQLPLASITKVALALLAHEHLDPKGTLTITQRALATEGESGFTLGEAWKTRDLIDFTLMTSSNDGAVALAENIERVTSIDIATLLNEQAKQLNLTQTYFINETGLDSSTVFSGTYGSAQDVAKLFSYVYTTAPELLAATARTHHTFISLDGAVYEAENTNKAVANLPGLVFGKTGFTDLAGGNLAVVTESEPGHPFVIVVLGSTVPERFTDVIALARATLSKPTQ